MEEMKGFLIENGVLLRYLGEQAQVHVPRGVRRIGGQAFSGCARVSSVELPESVEQIDGGAFANCTNLTQVRLPRYLDRIGEGAFLECESLTDITLPAGIQEIADCTFEGCIRLERVTVPKYLQRIGSGAFAFCKSLTLAPLTCHVTHIGVYAFRGCAAMELPEVPEGLVYVGAGAFLGCEKMADPQGHITVRGVYYGCARGIKELVIPAGVTSIEDGAFLGHETLARVEIPYGVTRIGRTAFEGCKSLTAVTLPETVTEIPYQAFYGCGALAEVVIPGTVETVCAEAFAECASLFSVKLEAGVKGLERDVFRDCPALERLVLPGSVEQLGEFMGRTVKTQIYAPATPLAAFPAGYRVAMVQAFARSVARGEDYTGQIRQGYVQYMRKCRSKLFPLCLEQPELLQVLLDEALIPVGEVEALLCLLKPEDTTILAALLDYRERHMTAQERLQLSQPEELLDWDLDWKPKTEAELKKEWKVELLPGNTLRLVAYKGKDTNVVVPEAIGSRRVTELGDYALSPAAERISRQQILIREKIRTVSVPEGVTCIGEGAFESCKELLLAELPTTLRVLGRGAFFHCKALCQVALHGQLQELLSLTFRGCASLTSLEIPGSVTQVDSFALADCESLKEVRIGDGAGIIRRWAFAQCQALERVTFLGKGTRVEDMLAMKPSVLGQVKPADGSVTLCGPEGCYAQAYAEKYGLTFEKLPGV